MSYTKKDLARGLKQQLSAGYDVVRIARWAHTAFLEHSQELEPGLQPIIMKIVAMEEGPEFELSENELKNLLRELDG